MIIICPIIMQIILIHLHYYHVNHTQINQTAIIKIYWSTRLEVLFWSNVSVCDLNNTKQKLPVPFISIIPLTDIYHERKIPNYRFNWNTIEDEMSNSIYYFVLYWSGYCYLRRSRQNELKVPISFMYSMLADTIKKIKINID